MDTDNMGYVLGSGSKRGEVNRKKGDMCKTSNNKEFKKIKIKIK